MSTPNEEGIETMNYPLQLSFKILAFAPQIRVIDSQGQLVFYVKQKLFKLKEAIGVFADEQQTQKLFDIQADRVIDFSARYNFKNANGEPIGGVKRQGMKSLFKAHFDVLPGQGDQAAATIQETNPWTKFFDAMFTQVPIAGMFSGYLFHPEYEVTRTDGTALMRLKKQPAFLEGKFSIEKVAELADENEEHRMLLSLMMMLLLERSRG